MLPSFCLLMCPHHEERGLNLPSAAAFITNERVSVRRASSPAQGMPGSERQVLGGSNGLGGGGLAPSGEAGGALSSRGGGRRGRGCGKAPGVAAAALVLP